MWRALPLVGVHNPRSRAAARAAGTASPCGWWGGWGARVRPGARPADGEGMRASHVATALAAFTAGLTAATALHRRAGRRVPARTVVAPPAPVTAPHQDAAAEHDAVVLEFPRPALVEQPARPAAPTRCGDNGGVTRAGAPCAARATSNGRCHHHPVAA